MNIALDRAQTSPSPEALERHISQAAKALLARQHGDGHWRLELEADATIPAEYVLLRHFRGEAPDLELERLIAVYLRRVQGDHGGWPLFHAGAFDMSASVKAYFALKMIGDDVEAPHMRKAREAILARGGAARSNVFTRFLLALYGAIPWSGVPTMPVEIMLLPRWFPFHLDKVSYWARTVLVPLLVLQALKPRPANPRGVAIAELFVAPPETVRDWPTGAHQSWGWVKFFGAIDRLLKLAEPFFPRALRRRAIDAANAFVTERLNGEDGLGAIYPAMANAVLMFDALGYPKDHPDLVVARRSIERLLVVGEDEAYCQPCLSPVWDTALATHALLEAGDAASAAQARAGLAWLKPRQILEVKGDWAARRPDVRPGGWAFQYDNHTIPISTTPRWWRWRWTAPTATASARPAGLTPRRSPARANGSRDCRAATAAGPPSTPTTPITISTISPSPTTAPCSIRRPPTSPRAASPCSPSSARRARRARRWRAASTRCSPPRKRTEAG